MTFKTNKDYLTNSCYLVIFKEYDPLLYLMYVDT